MCKRYFWWRTVIQNIQRILNNKMNKRPKKISHIQMANKHMKKKNAQHLMPNAGKSIEQQELSFTTGGNVKWYHETIQQFLRYLNIVIESSHQSCSLLFNQMRWKHANRTIWHANIYVSFIHSIAKTWKQPRYSSAGNKLCYIQTMDY